MISDAAEEVPDEASPHGRAASIHIEFPGRALVSIEAGVDPALVAAVIERLMR